MKKPQKLLRLCLILLLVFFTFSAGVTASAAGKNVKNCKKAFSSITVTFTSGTKSKVPLKTYPEEAGAVTTGNKLKVKVKTKKGWKLKKMSYYNANTGKTKKLKNGGSVKLNYNADSAVIIKAKKKKKSATYTLHVFRSSL